MEAPWNWKQLLFVLYSCGENLEIIWELKHKYKNNILFSPKTWFITLALLFFLRNKNNYKGTNTMRNKLWGKTPYSLLGHFFCIISKSFSNGTKSPKILKPVTLLYSNWYLLFIPQFFFFFGCTGLLAASWHVGSSWTRETNCVILHRQVESVPLRHQWSPYLFQNKLFSASLTAFSQLSISSFNIKLHTF